MKMRAVLILLLFGLYSAGCSGDATPKAQDDASVPTSDAGADAADDVSSKEDDVDAATESGAFEIGTNTAYEAEPASFLPMSDGSEVPVSFGVQGFWMVVLAFRTQDLVEGTFDLEGEITIDGVEAGSVWYEFQETFPGGDGWDYYYNFFLALDERPTTGSSAHILMRVTDQDGTTVQREHDVLIGEVADSP